MTEDRLRVLRPMIELDAEAAGSFFINIVAVFPEYRHAGLARRLIGLACEKARTAGIAAVSLTTFEDDARLIPYYLGIGFRVAASRSLEPHECMLSAGNLVMMTMPIGRFDPTAPTYVHGEQVAGRCGIRYARDVRRNAGPSTGPQGLSPPHRPCRASTDRARPIASSVIPIAKKQLANGDPGQDAPLATFRLRRRGPIDGG